MPGFFHIIALIIAVVAIIPAGFFALEVAGAFFPAKSVKSADGKTGEAAVRGAAAVIVPAHNEGDEVIATLQDIKAQMQRGDRLIVVADNCDDNTADIARANGAECLERDDKNRRGKGYALQFALEALRSDPPDIVIFADADCRLSKGALDALGLAAQHHNRPIQALYLMKAPGLAPPRLQVAAFAWLVVNQVRMGGLDTLFGVSRLTGAGMAMPWPIVEKLDLASGEIVEDLALTLELVRRRAAPMFLPSVIVESVFPASEEGAAKQRARWEQGSMKLASRRAAPLFIEGVAKGNLRLIVMALDLLIPPLTILAGLVAVALLAGVGAFLTGFATPFWLSVAALVLFAAALTAAWVRFGQGALPAASLGGLFRFLLGKLRVYGREGRQSAKSWTRTERANDKRETKP